MPSMLFTLEGRDNLSRHMDRAGNSSDTLARKLLKLGAVGGGAPMGAAVVAGTGMMIAGFASAGAAAGAFKAAVQPQLAEVTKASDLYTKAQEAQAEGGEKAAAASKAYKDALAKLPPATRDTAKAFIGLKNDYAKWSDSLSDDTMPVFTKGIEMARKALPYLTPLVKTTGRALSEFMDGLDGGGLKSFVGRLDSAAKKTLPDLLSTGRNVFVGLGGIISAFLPTSDRFTGGLERGSEAFAKWGQGLGDSAGFQRFMDIATEGSGSLKDLALAGLDVLDAIRPLIGTSIQVAEGFAKFIRWLPPETLQFIAGGLIAVKLATLGVNGALALMSANPVTLVMGAVLLLGAAFVTAWQKSQRFREIASSGMAIVAQSVLGQTRVMLYGFKLFSESAIAGMQGVIEAAVGMFGSLPGIGPKLKKAAEAARGFKDDTGKYFDEAIGKVDAYSREVDRMPTVIRLQGDITNLSDKISAAQAKVDGLKQKRKTAVGADKGRLDDAIAKAQAKVDGLKQKRAVTVAALDRASGKIATVRWNLSMLRNKSVTITTYYQYKGKTIAPQSAGRMASGGPIGFPGGGPISGPGTATSDSIPIMASNGEYMINARSTAKYRSLVEAINADTLGAGTFGGGAGGAGRDVAKGLASGMTGSAGLVEGASRRMAAAVTLGIKGELEISSPSKKTKALAQDVAKGFLEGLTGSRSKIKAVSADLAKDIKTAFSGKKEASLLKMLKEVTYKNDRQAKYRDVIAAKIKEAKEYASTLTSSAREGAGLSNLGMDADEVTAGGIKGGLAQKLSQVRQFAAYIKKLAERGLSKGLLRQILNMGPEQGYAYASALVGADKATFKQINSLQSQLDTSTKSLGEIGADRLYDAGKNAGKGFLKGLEGQQKSIEDLMMRIAKAMQKSLRKALGINSPATEMVPDGVNTMRGVAVGVLQGLPYVEDAMGAVAARMTGRVGGAAPVLGRPAVVGRGGGGATVHIHVNGAVVDKLGAARAMREAFLELKRANGGGDLGLA